MTKPHVVILGAGPAGLGAAFQLARQASAQVTVLEQNSQIGGTAGSFELAGVRVDYGSHRLHPACDPQILHDIRTLLGDDLLNRPRHGRIRLQGRWVHFPLKPFDLALKLPPSFTLGVAQDLVGKIVRVNGRATRENKETFASVLERGLGRTICRDFYFPYAQKLWGLDPEALSATQARRRVSTSSLTKMARKVLSAVPGLRSPRSGHFFYPRHGFGQICEAFHRAARESGARIYLNASVRAVELADNGVHTVRYERDGQIVSIEADYVWSTIPITALARTLKPSPPPECLRAAEHLDYRGMILIYLVLEQDRFSEFDAHYFPGAEIPISRLSEPKNYSNAKSPSGQTVLCAELPCAPDGPEWDQGDDELGRLVHHSLKVAGIPVQAQVRQVVTRRLEYAYPIYRQGYETAFDRLDQWIGQIDGLLTFGRQGLFAHDNTHHALYTGYAAADCLDERGHFDRDRWQDYRRIFETHVVED
jgi:protoporphyrinogen oxidase